ncbi:MAG: mevalonate kinase [Aerococcus sp.]|nr:mevalonate kinase [Aerococcus sp.]
MKEAVGQAHGKIILIGDHSVVYGSPSIAVPFQAADVSVTLSAAGNHSHIVSDLYEGAVRSAPDSLDGLVGLLNLLRRDHEVEHYHFMITIQSSLPIERGLGSSAALSVAFIRAFYRYLDQPLSSQTLLHYTDYAETITHGNPSGLDARVTALNQPLFFKKGEIQEPFHFDTPYWLLVCDTGVPGHTKEAVSEVRSHFESRFSTRRQATHRAIASLGQLVNQMRQALIETTTTPHTASHGKHLGQLINAAQRELRTLQVSSPELDAGMNYVIEHGALGAKLTGGGKGGCFYALVEDEASGETLSHALMEQQLVRDTWLMPFSSEGMGHALQDSDAEDTNSGRQ